MEVKYIHHDNERIRILKDCHMHTLSQAFHTDPSTNGRRSVTVDHGLNSDDFKSLSINGNWLTDKHINAVQKLLSKQFPAQNGLQDCLILEKCLRYTSDVHSFVQILHLPNHWVCISNLFSPPGTVDVYNSLPSMSKSSLALFKQVAAILKTSNRFFQLRHVNVQHQNGTADCGLFAIANAVVLCMKGNPHTCNFNQDTMHPHLYKCFMESNIRPLPSLGRPRRSGIKKFLSLETVQVFCLCRLPWDKYDTLRGPMVHCSKCKEWYHRLCCNIPKKTIDNPTSSYICPSCLSHDTLT